MILTLTGASGAGKTTIAKRILEKLPNARMLTSYTTRQPRETDLRGEYSYISEEEFRAMQDRGEFLWAVFVHGIHYGTTLRSLQEAADKPKEIFIMILFYSVLLTLWSYAKKINLSVYSSYILSPSPAILEERLNKREADPELIKKRIEDCLTWDDEAWNSGIPYFFVKNETTVEEAVDKVITRYGYIKP